MKTYLKRHIAQALREMGSTFPVVLVTGPRQAGKSTLLQKEVGGLPYFTLDDYILLDSVKRDSLGFIDANEPPMMIDEIQYAPELMRAIKMHVDRERKAGSYYLSGSQQFELMKGVSESLAGRIGILNLLGLSAREMDGDAFTAPFLPTEAYLLERKKTAHISKSKQLWQRIHTGGMPELCTNHNMRWDMFYSSYVKTYIERDVRALTQVGDELTFMQFISACAARTGQLLNMASIAAEIGVSQPTAKRWLSILQTSNIVYLLQPFSLNVSARVMKTPKLYFLDTGLAAYLCKWLTPETLEHGAMAGAFFETYVVSEIMKSYYNAGKEPSIYFYRDINQREIDLVFYENGKLYPLEIKKTGSPNAADVRVFDVLSENTALEVAPGGILCTYDKVVPLGGGHKSIPISYI